MGVHRDQGRLGLQRARRQALGRRRGDADRLRGRADHLRAGLAALDRHPHPEGAGRAAGAVDGGRPGEPRRQVGRGPHQRRPRRQRRRRLPILDQDKKIEQAMLSLHQVLYYRWQKKSAKNVLHRYAQIY